MAGVVTLPLVTPIAPSTLFTDTSAQNGTAITTPASANAYSAYTQLIAASAAAAKCFYLFCNETTASGNAFSVKIATGGAGSEVDILKNLIWQSPTTTNAMYCQQGPFYINIPAGTRLSAAVANNSASALATKILIILGE